MTETEARAYLVQTARIWTSERTKHSVKEESLWQ